VRGIPVAWAARIIFALGATWRSDPRQHPSVHHDHVRPSAMAIVPRPTR